MPSMNGAKFCWSFQQTEAARVRSRCRNTLPGQEFGPPSRPGVDGRGAAVAGRVGRGGAAGLVEPVGRRRCRRPAGRRPAPAPRPRSARGCRCWKSSTVALRNGSAYCERPIQFWVVLPRLDGCRVMAVLVATAVPLTYSVPVLPDSVTARCDHVFSGSCAVPLSRCSPPLPLVVMAKRGRGAGVDRQEHVGRRAGAEVEHPRPGACSRPG